jgi:putative intracellular protease/amidase
MQRRDFLAAAGLGLIAGSGQALAAFDDKRPDPARSPALRPPAKGLIRVAFAISQSTTEIDYIGPKAVFESWYTDPATGKPEPQYELYTVSHTTEPLDNRIAKYTFDTAPAPHIVVVPAQRGSPALVEWLKKVSRTTDVTMSVCLGARHLARAGLLKGKSATTHHSAIDDLAEEFPETKWVRGVRFVEEGNISTGGGLTAGIDLALHVVERYFGRPRAREVAEHLEYECTGWIQ